MTREKIDWDKLKKKVELDRKQEYSKSFRGKLQRLGSRERKKVRSHVPFTPRKGRFNTQRFATGVAGMMTGQPAQSQKSKARVKQDRGRPEGTFKQRVLPDGTLVSVPTAVFNKMRTAQRSQIRLRAELRQARMSANAPMDHVRQQGAEDAWLMAEDFQPQQMQGYPQEMGQEDMAPQMSPLDRLRNMMARRRGFGGGQGMSGQGIGGDQGFGPQIQGRVEQPPMHAGPNGTPRLNIWGGPSSILHAGNKFNNRGQTEVRP